MNTQTVLTFLENHVWQSTAFALVVGALSLLLRKDRAAIRHRLWVAASIKFLIPLSLFAAIGSQFGGFWHTPVSVSPSLDTFEQWNEPFNSLTIVRSQSGQMVNAAPVQPPWLLPLWIVGASVVLLMSLRRWLHMRRIVRAATSLASGFEFDTVARLQKAVGFPRTIPIVSSDSMIEPGLFGVIQPTLFLPAALREKVTDDQLEAILSHEVMHARRHDNLWTALHMIVEAAFWFNPMVWWLGSCLVDERERACDQEVLSAGCEPIIYAQAVLEVCKSYLGTGLKCASGVTGGALQKRIEAIMVHVALPKLNAVKRFLLAIPAVSVICVPLGLGSMHARGKIPQAAVMPSGAIPQSSATADALPIAQPRLQMAVPTSAVATLKREHSQPQSVVSPPHDATNRPVFEVAAIHPNNSGSGSTSIGIRLGGRLMATNASLKMLMVNAYKVQDFQIVGGPNWIDSAKFDVEAVNTAVPDDQVGVMLQSLLEDRFHLKFHRESKEGDVFVLVVDKHGSKLSEIKGDSDAADHGIYFGPDGITSTNSSTVAGFAGILQNVLRRTVIDQTDLKGYFNIQLHWGKFGPSNAADSVDTAGSSIFTAIQEQLGFRLESRKGPVEVLVIDSVEKPAE